MEAVAAAKQYHAAHLSRCHDEQDVDDFTNNVDGRITQTVVEAKPYRLGNIMLTTLYSLDHHTNDRLPETSSHPDEGNNFDDGDMIMMTHQKITTKNHHHHNNDPQSALLKELKGEHLLKPLLLQRSHHCRVIILIIISISTKSISTMSIST